MKIIFMGTPDFAAAALEELVTKGYDVVLAVTQPDRESGRGKKINKSPVKECAKKHGINIFQPEKIKEPEAVCELKKYNADIFVVAAFGQILSPEILNMPPLGCVNIHASLLPKYRGASPIQWAILNGDDKSGITIMQMDEGVDTGDIIYQRSIDIDLSDTAGTLFDRLTSLGAEAICEALDLIKEGKINRIKQDDTKATHTGKISKDMGHINFKDEAALIERYIRGLDPWPSAYTYLDGKSLKIWKAEVIENDSTVTTPGAVTGVSKDSFTVATGKGSLKILEVQFEGKKRMSVHDFMLGRKIEEGTVLK